MTHNRLEKALKKTGATITEESTNYFQAQIGRLIVNWSNQNGTAVCVHCTKTDAKTYGNLDYLPGFFAYTIKEATNYLSN